LNLFRSLFGSYPSPEGFFFAFFSRPPSLLHDLAADDQLLPGPSRSGAASDLGTALLFLAERHTINQAKVKLSAKQIRKLARPVRIVREAKQPDPMPSPALR
jgi:hypothetical protein